MIGGSVYSILWVNDFCLSSFSGSLFIITPKKTTCNLKMAALEKENI